MEVIGQARRMADMTARAAATARDDAKAIEGAVLDCARLRACVAPAMGLGARLILAVRVARALRGDAAAKPRSSTPGRA